MLKKPLVSILMPVYNSYGHVRSEGKDLLRVALNSLLSQTHKNIELIILDNQSTDETASVIQSFAKKDSRIKYILDSRRRYPEGAITHLVTFARGKYCMIANDDDLWDSTYIQRLVCYLENNENIDLCYSNARTIDIDGSRSSPIVGSDDEYSHQSNAVTNYLKFVHKRNIIPIAFGVYRTSSFKKILPFHKFDNLKANVDNLFMIKFFLNGGNVVFVNEALFYYRKKERKLDPSKVEDMPSIDKPIDIFLYYANHQLALCKEIDILINKSKFIKSQKLICKIWLIISTIDFSINLLIWVKNDIAKDHNHQRIISKVLSKFDTQSIPTYIDPSLVSVEYIDEVRVKSLAALTIALMRNYDNSLLSLVKYSFYKKNYTYYKLIKSYRSSVIEITKKDNLFNVTRNINIGSSNPTISIIITSYNLCKYLKETIDSVVSQTIKKFEIIIIDGHSTDGSIDIIRNYVKMYPDVVKLVSEPDTGYPEAFWKGIKLSKGKFITQCAVSDGYASSKWLDSACGFLEKNNSISLVWGFAQYIDEKSNKGAISYPQFHKKVAPSMVDFYKYWLKTGFYFPEGNLVVRKNVLEKCYPKLTELGSNTLDWLEFSYRFNKAGYLSHHLPIIANYGRVHDGQKGEELKKGGRLSKMLINYKMKVAIHKFLKLFKPKMTFISPDNEKIYSIKIDSKDILTEYVRKFINNLYSYYTKVKNGFI